MYTSMMFVFSHPNMSFCYKFKKNLYINASRHISHINIDRQINVHLIYYKKIHFYYCLVSLIKHVALIFYKQVFNLTKRGSI